jgi:hypothetical protein
VTAPDGPPCGKCGHSWFDHSVEPLNPDGSLDGGFVGLCEVAISERPGAEEFCSCDGFRSETCVCGFEDRPYRAFHESVLHDNILTARARGPAP